MIKYLISMFAVVLFVVPWLSSQSVSAQELTPSQRYVEDMGDGWNLGNTFDGFDEAGDRGEESWGNPIVTRELIQTVKDKGFDNIRIPFTAYQRLSGPEDNDQIQEEFLDRYEEVVNWALEADLYVMVNVHHDSWTWLEYWDGDIESEEYVRFTRIWEQLAERFKDYDDRVMFESINEPVFDTEEENALTFLETINDRFYQIVRNSGGNNAERMLILPSLLTDYTQNKLDTLYNQITGFDDENLIATVHYYSEWVYSANLGITRFDEVLWDDVTSRTSLMTVFDRVSDTFADNGIGVVIGEYGLLGYDKNDYVNQLGETLKFLDFINYYTAEQTGMSLILWDNGQHISRYDYEWQNPLFGAMIEASMEGRSSYSTGLDTLFLTDPVPEGGLSIPLTLNGNELVAIYSGDTALIEGTDYTYSDSTIHLTEAYLNRVQDQTGGEIGEDVTLRMQFTSGADWYQTLVYTASPEMMEAQGSVGEALTIPTDFNGNQLKSVVSQNQEGTIVSNNSWWGFLEHSFEFSPNNSEGTIQMLPVYTNLLSDGQYNLTFAFYNEEELSYQLTVENGLITGEVLSLVEEPEEEETEPIEEPDEEIEEPIEAEPDEEVETPEVPVEEESSEETGESEVPVELDPETTPEPESPVEPDLEESSSGSEEPQLEVVVEHTNDDSSTSVTIPVPNKETGQATRQGEKSTEGPVKKEMNGARMLPATGMVLSATGLIGSLFLSSGLGLALLNKKKK